VVAFGIFVSTRIEPTSAVIGCQRFRADPI
jgi:hypothetical protein